MPDVLIPPPSPASGLAEPDRLTLDQIRAVLATSASERPDTRLSYPRHLRTWLAAVLERVEVLEKKERRLVEDCAAGELICPPPR